MSEPDQAITHDLDALNLRHEESSDDFGRDDLCGGLGWVLLISVLFYAVIAVVIIWRVFA